MRKATFVERCVHSFALKNIRFFRHIWTKESQCHNKISNHGVLSWPRMSDPREGGAEKNGHIKRECERERERERPQGGGGGGDGRSTEKNNIFPLSADTPMDPAHVINITLSLSLIL